MVCQDTTTSVPAFLPNWRCSPPTGGAPWRSGCNQAIGPCGRDPSSTAPPPRLTPRAAETAPVVSNRRRVTGAAAVAARSGAECGSSLMLASYRSRATAGTAAGKQRTAANESGSVFDMTNVQRTASAISAVMLAVATGAVLTPATSYADPPGHQVTY